MASRVRLSSVEVGDSEAPNEVGALEILINPVRNRTDGEQLHSRRLLKMKGKARAKAVGELAQRSHATVVDAREPEALPLASVDFAEEVAEARLQAEREK